MAFKVVRFGSERRNGEGLRIGTVRRPPRGVKKEEYGERNYFDIWLPELAPSAELVAWANAEPHSAKRRATLERQYRSEMKTPTTKHLIQLLANLSINTDFAIGCYCEVENQCHRSILKQLLIEQGGQIA